MEGRPQAFQASNGRGAVDVDRILNDTNATIEASLQTINETRHERRGFDPVAPVEVDDERARVEIRDRLFAASASASIASHVASLAAMEVVSRAASDTQRGEDGSTADSASVDGGAFEQDSLDCSPQSLDPTVAHVSDDNVDGECDVAGGGDGGPRGDGGGSSETEVRSTQPALHDAARWTRAATPTRHQASMDTKTPLHQYCLLYTSPSPRDRG